MAISFDQASGLTSSGNTTTTTQVVTWATLPTATAKAILSVAWKNSTVTISSIVDNGTTPRTFTAGDVETVGTGSTQHHVQHFYADNITLPGSGSYAATITFGSTGVSFASGGATYLGVKSGASTTSSVGNNGGSAGTSISTGSATDANSGSLYIASANTAASTTITWTYTGGGTQRVTNNNGSTQVFGFADFITSGAIAQTWTQSVSATWAAVESVWEAAPVPPVADVYQFAQSVKRASLW